MTPSTARTWRAIPRASKLPAGSSTTKLAPPRRWFCQFAAELFAAGAPFGQVAGLVWTEAGIALAYAAAGFLFFCFLEHESRRSAVLDAD